MPIWIPRDEIRADLEDQAKKRLDEIARAMSARKTQMVEQTQSALQQTHTDDLTSRFNALIDPLIQQGRQGIDTLTGGNLRPDAPGHISDEVRRLVEQHSQPQPTVQPDPLQPPTDGLTPSSLSSGAAPEAPTPPAPLPEPTAPTPPPLPTPPPPTPSFKPPGLPGLPGMDGIGSALGGIGSAMGGLGQGISGLGDKVTEGRDQAMELANKSLDVAQQAMGNAGNSFQQTPIARAGQDFGGWRDEQVAEQERWGNVPRFPGSTAEHRPEELQRQLASPSTPTPFTPPGVAPRRDPFSGITDALSGFREANAAALADPARAADQQAWESYQGQEREGAWEGQTDPIGAAGAILGNAWRGATGGYEKDRRRQEEQTRTALGYGDEGADLLAQGQAGFGAAMGPYGAIPEVARGAVEEATGSPLLGAGAYAAASILGPGGIRSFLRESGPLATRLITNIRNPSEIAAIAKEVGNPNVFKALALTTGVVGGTGLGIKTGIDAIREGATPQEAAARAVEQAADILQISEAAGIPIDAAAKVAGALPKLGIQPPRIPGLPGIRPPSLPGMPGAPEIPGRPAAPGAPGAPTEPTPSLPGERAPEVRPEERAPEEATPEVGASVAPGARPGASVPRPGPEGSPALDMALARGEAPTAAQIFQEQTDAARASAQQVENQTLAASPPEQSAVAYDEVRKKTEAEARRPTPGTPEAPRDYDPNGLGTGIPVAPRSQVAGAPPTPRLDPRSLISDPQAASTGPATTTPSAAENLRRVAEGLAGEGPQAEGMAGRPAAVGETDPTGFQRGVGTPGKAIYDAIVSGKASTVEGFRKVVREILGRDPVTKGKTSEAIAYLKGFPRTESGREVPDFLFNPEHNPAVRETTDADGNTTRTLPSGLFVTLNPQGQVIGEQRLRRADDPVSYVQGALQDYGEARDPTSGLLYRDWYIDTSGVLADVAKRVAGGDEKSPNFRNVLNNLTAAVGITTPQTEPTANIKKALYLNILYRDWKKARASAGLEVREPTWQELVDMGRTGQVVVGLKRPVAPGAPITLADEAPILGGYHTVKEGSAKVSDWEPLIPGLSGPGDHRVLAKNPGWVVDEILMGNQAESFVNAMRTGELSVQNGRKSPTFGLQLFNAWARRFLPWSVEDRHMHEAAGVNYDVESHSSGIYDVLQGITRAHGDMYPGRPMDPHQAQAAIWAFEKFENAASKADNDPEMILPDAIRMPDGRVIPAGEHAPRGTMLDMRNRLRQLSDQFAQSYTGPFTGNSAMWDAKTGEFKETALKGEHIGITNKAAPYETKGPFSGMQSQKVGYDVVRAAEGAARREGYAVTAEGELPGIATDDGGRRYLDWLDEDHEVGADGRTVHTYSTDERKAQYVAARIGERTGAEAVGYVIATPEGGDRSVLLVGKPDGGTWTTGEVRSLSEQVGAQAALTPDGTHVYWADTSTGAAGTGPDMGAVRAGLETHLDGSYTVREARAVTGAVTADQRAAVLSTTFPRDEPRRIGESVGYGDDGRPGGAAYPSPYGSRAGGEGPKVPRRLPVPPIAGTRAFGPLGGEYAAGTRGKPATARKPAVEPVPTRGLNAPARITDSAGQPIDYTPAALPAPAAGVAGAPELQGAPGKAPRGPVGIAIENARITHAFDQAPPLEGGGRLLDEDGEHAVEAVQRVASAPETNRAASYVQATLQHIRNRLVSLLPDQADAYGQAHFGGLAVGNKYYAANYDGARVLRDPEAGNQILTNLHAIHGDVAGEVRSGLIDAAQAPESMAHRIVLKLVHELTHQEVWQHDGKTKPKEFTFDQALNRNLDLLAPDIDRLTAQLAAQIRDGGLYDAVGRQADDLRTNLRSAGEVAARPPGVPGQPAGQPGDAALGAGEGGSGRGEPAGVVGDRLGGAEPELGTGADLGAGEPGASGEPGVAAAEPGGDAGAGAGVAPGAEPRERSLAVAYARRKNPPPAGEPPPEWGVPEHNRQGHAMGLGNMDTRADMDRILGNPPEGGYTGDQLNEIARFGARLGAREAMDVAKEGGITPEQRAQQSAAEGRRRPTRAAEGSPDLGTTIQNEMGATGRAADVADTAQREQAAKEHTRRVNEAQGPSEVEDALADAEDAAIRGEIQPSDADDARGIAARKLQRARGGDEPLGPNDLDNATAASRQRRGVRKPEPAPPKGNGVAEAFQRSADRQRSRSREDKRSAIDKIVDDAERATAERAKAEGSAGKQPVAFPDARPIEPPRPGAGGEPAVVKPDLTQPPTGEPGRVPLPGFEGMVTKLQSIAEDMQKEADQKAGARSPVAPEVEGTAARLPVEAQRVPGAPEPVARVAGEPPAPGEYRTELPGIGARERGAPSRLAGGSTPAEVADRLAEQALSQDKAVADAAKRALAEMQAPQRREPSGPQLPLREITGEAEGAEGLGGLVPKELAPSFSGGAASLRDIGDRNILIGPDGEIMTRARAQANLLGRMAKPGGWAEVRDEMFGLASDPIKWAFALGKQIPTSADDMKKIYGEAEKLFGFKAPDWEALGKGEKRFRLGHTLDLLGAYSRVNLIFNPESWMRNVLSTTVGVPYRLTEAVLSPFWNKAWKEIGNRDAESRYVGESVAMLEGLVRSISAASANALGTVRRGNEAGRVAMLDDPQAASFYNTRIGKGMEKFFRPLTAGDVFFKTLNEGMESFRLAYRQASDEADSGVWGANPLHSKLRSRMWEIASTATPKFLDQVQQAGEYNTFNQKADGFIKRIEAFKNYDGPGGAAVRLLANIAVPFVRIPVNVAKWGFERTPVGGLINTAVGGLQKTKVRDENGKLVTKYTRGSGEMADRSARMTQGVLLAATLYGAEQAGMIEISGGKPDNEDEAEEWKLQGKTPYSVRIGDRWYDPSNFPGIGQTVLQAGILKDAVGAWQTTDEGESDELFDRVGSVLGKGMGAASKGLEAYVGQEQIRPMFGSLTHALVAFNPAFPEQQRAYSREQLLNSAVSQFTPLSGAGRAIGGITDPYEREANTVPERIAALNPFTRENLSERYDALGNPVASERYSDWTAGVTSSRAASEETLPRVYRGSTSAAMDREITRAVTAVNNYERDRRSYRPPTAAERTLARRYGDRKNPARERLNAKVARADRIRELQRLNRGEDEGPLRFRAPTRLNELVGA